MDPLCEGSLTLTLFGAAVTEDVQVKMGPKVLFYLSWQNPTKFKN